MNKRTDPFSSAGQSGGAASGEKFTGGLRGRTAVLSVEHALRTEVSRKRRYIYEYRLAKPAGLGVDRVWRQSDIFS